MAQPALFKARVIEFFVAGEPIPQGSKTNMPLPGGRVVMVESNRKTKPWRKAVKTAAWLAMDDEAIHNGPVSIRVVFAFDRPGSTEFDTKCTKPDVDKLVRAIFDAMKGTIYSDDCRVIELNARKVYTGGEYPKEGAYVRVELVV